MPELVIKEGPLKGQIFDLGSKEIVFCGRSPKMNDIAISEIAISRKHFKIFKIGKDFFIEDLNSKNGTLVNGKFIEPGEGFQINEGDLIAVGNNVMQLADVGGRGSLVNPVPRPEAVLGDEPSESESRKERRSAKELELVFNVSELLKRHLDMDAFFKEFLKLVLEALPRLDNASVFLVQKSNNSTMKLVEVIAKSHEKSASRYKKEIVNKVILEQKTVRMSNIEFESPQSNVEKDDTLEIKSAMCLPILSGDEFLGAIYIESLKPYGFRKRDQFLLNSLVGSMAVAIEKYRLAGESLSDKHPVFKDKIINIFKKN